MACGCKKSKKKTEIQQSVSYESNGNGTVRLGLKEQIRLPIRMPNAVAGQDIIIVANSKTSVPQFEVTAGGKPALVVIGRNAFVDVEHKEKLIAKWPRAFNAA